MFDLSNQNFCVPLALYEFVESLLTNPLLLTLMCDADGDDDLLERRDRLALPRSGWKSRKSSVGGERPRPPSCPDWLEPKWVIGFSRNG